MNRVAAAFAIGAVLGTFDVRAKAAEVRLTDQTVVRFADVVQGIEALTRRDDYIRQLSPFDRQVRLKTDRDVSEQEFLAFIASHVRPWSEEEIARLAPVFAALGEKLRPWKLNLPPEILLVKTSGDEEGAAAYCRGAAIVLPQNVVDNRRGNRGKILPHEIFHVLSSHNPELRRQLYAIVGFRPSNEVRLPESLRRQKITNPDAPRNDYTFNAEFDGSPREWVPVLISKSARYDPAQGGNLFAYLDFKLMQVENKNGRWEPALRDGQPILVEPADVPGYAQQIGDNTKYIIHPEEVLADNLVHLINGRIALPRPRIVEQMGNVLQAAAAEVR